MEKMLGSITFLIGQIEKFTPPEKIKWVMDYINANELGMAFELILELTSEYDIPLTGEFKEKANLCGDQMQIDVSAYL